MRALSLCTCCRQYPGAATGRRLRSSHPAVSAFPEIAVGSACTSSFSRLARRSLALRPAHSRRHLYVTCYTEGFSHFVTSMTAPVASGWSVRRVGLAPTGKRRLLTAHAISGRSPTPRRKIGPRPHGGCQCARPDEATAERRLALFAIGQRPVRTRRPASGLPPQTLPTIQALPRDGNQAKAKDAARWLIEGGLPQPLLAHHSWIGRRFGQIDPIHSFVVDPSREIRT